MLNQSILPVVRPLKNNIGIGRGFTPESLKQPSFTYVAGTTKKDKFEVIHM